MKITTKKITTLEDYKLIQSITNDVWPKTYSSILTPQQIDYMLDMMYSEKVFVDEIAKGYTWELISIDDKIVGYISFATYENDSSCAKLHKVYLLEEFQGRGYGSMMLQHAIKSCQTLGYKAIRLNVNKDNAKAQKCYTKNGFTIVDAIKADIGNNFIMDDYIMQCTL